MAEPRGGPSGYVLGVDLGTTYTAAAISRGSTADVFVLGTISPQIPSVVVHREDGEVLTGEAAERRATSEPTRTAREFKRRLGDPVPIIVGGTPYGAEALMAELLEAIVRQVSEREGQAPSLVVLTHPANYSEYKRGLLLEAARLAGLDLDHVRLITEPEAAAISYAHQQRIEPGEVIAVYDFGGGTFDAAVVRDTTDGFELIGTPEGIERLGGIDFDQAVLVHVDSALDGMVSSADASDPQVRMGQARLRDDCRRAKEALSSDTDVTIAVSIPGVQTDVRLTRDELEQMVRPRVAETVRALQRTIASAGVAPEDVGRVLLVGGSSRMPIVAQVVHESLGRPVTADADPKLAIALGAARSAAPTTLDRPTLEPVAAAGPAPAFAAPPSTASADPRPRRRRVWPIVAGAAAGAVVVAVILVATSGGKDGTAAPAAATNAVTETGATTTESTGSAAPVTSVGSAEQAAGAQRFAFDGSDQGSGIPGAALAAGAPGALGAVAVGPDGDVFVTSSGVPVLDVGGDEVEAVAGFGPDDLTSMGITVGSDGAVYVSTPTGIVRVDHGVHELVLDGAAAGLSTDLGPLAFDGGGNLYVADNGTARIIRVAPDGGLTLVAGTGTPAVAGAVTADGDVAASSPIGKVTGLVIDPGGNLLIADNGQSLVRSVAGDGTIRTVASAADLALDSVGGIALAEDGSLFVASDAGGGIVRLGSNGEAVAVLDVGNAADGSAIGPVTAVAVLPSGDLVFSDGHSLWTTPGAAADG